MVTPNYKLLLMLKACAHHFLSTLSVRLCVHCTCLYLCARLAHLFFLRCRSNIFGKVRSRLFFFRSSRTQSRY